MPSTKTAAAAKSLQSYPTLRPHGRQLNRLPRPWDSPGKNNGVGCHFLLQCMKVKSESEVAQLCPTLHDPMGCSPPGSSVHGIFQARVLEWGAIAFSKNPCGWVQILAPSHTSSVTLRKGSGASRGICTSRSLAWADNGGAEWLAALQSAARAHELHWDTLASPLGALLRSVASSAAGFLGGTPPAP